MSRSTSKTNTALSRLRELPAEIPDSQPEDSQLEEESSTDSDREDSDFVAGPTASTRIVQHKAIIKGGTKLSPGSRKNSVGFSLLFRNFSGFSSNALYSTSFRRFNGCCLITSYLHNKRVYLYTQRHLGNACDYLF